MKTSFFYIFLFSSFLFSYEDKWATTRFERSWNSKFNTMQFRQPFSFVPYKIKVGSFYYGGDNYFKQFFNDTYEDFFSTSFETRDNIDFEDIEDISYKEGVKLEIDFLGYNIFKKVENKVDFILGLGYKLSMPRSKINMDSWTDDSDNKYDYYPVIQNLNINSTFAMQWSEKFSPYIYYSYGLVEAELFKNSNGHGFVNATGNSQRLSLGFNIVSKLKNKKYNLLYGFELALDDLQIDEINDISSPLVKINSQSVGVYFTIGIAYGGNKTDGDRGFSHLINSDYIDAINNFKSFKKGNLKHPKIKLANKMIEFSSRQIAYDMLYNGMDCYNNNDIECAIAWYNKAIKESNDKTLTYEIESRQYIIANDMFLKFDEFTDVFTIDESIKYIEYIESISTKIKKNTLNKKVDLYYEKANVFIDNKNYIYAYEMYEKNKKLFPQKDYIYNGHINSLVSLLIEKSNNAIIENDYILAYETTKFLNRIYPDVNDYIENNIRILKEDLDTNNTARINKILKEIISNVKKEFFPLDESTVIMIGNSYDKIIELLGEPIEFADRIRGDNLYLMSLHTVNNKTYRFYFENNILFDFEEIIK